MKVQRLQAVFSCVRPERQKKNSRILHYLDNYLAAERAAIAVRCFARQARPRPPTLGWDHQLFTACQTIMRAVHGALDYYDKLFTQRRPDN